MRRCARIRRSLKPGDSLVSSISLRQIHSVPEVMRPIGQELSPVASDLRAHGARRTPERRRLPAVVLRPQPDDLSRELAGRELAVLLSRRQILRTRRTLAQFEAWYRRPWIDTNAFLFDAPAEYMPSYGQHIAFADSYATLLLMLNFPADQKVNLTNYFVQYGIDLYGCVQAGYGWPAFGGHHSGRKLPIIFAGILLNNDGMKNVSQRTRTVWRRHAGVLRQQAAAGRHLPAGVARRDRDLRRSLRRETDGTPVSAGLYGPYEQLQPSAWPLLI